MIARIFALLLLLPCLAFADVEGLSEPTVEGLTEPTVEGIAHATAFCSCSGDLDFCWEVTANDTTITNSGGCSEGDTIAAATSSVELVAAPSGKTGYAIHAPTASDYYTFDVSTDDIISDDAGTIEFDIYIDTWADVSAVFEFDDGTANNEISIRTDGGSNTDIEFRLIYIGNTVAVAFSTSEVNGVEDTWYHIVAKWRQGVTDPSLSLQVDAIAASTNNTDLTNFASAGTRLRIGELQSTTNYTYIKNIKVYKSWQ